MEDCSEIWNEWISEATSSVLIFTPYFDELLSHLIEDTELAFSEICIVTQLDWMDKSSQNITRLRLILRLVMKGVRVRLLDRLHAKVLFVDNEKVIFGSQNFTLYSTGSYEISTELDFGDVYFDEVEAKLGDWLESSSEISFEDFAGVVQFLNEVDGVLLEGEEE